jgi:hypothetical protein
MPLLQQYGMGKCRSYHMTTAVTSLSKSAPWGLNKVSTCLENVLNYITTELYQPPGKSLKVGFRFVKFDRQNVFPNQITLLPLVGYKKKLIIETFYKTVGKIQVGLKPDKIISYFI